MNRFSLLFLALVLSFSLLGCKLESTASTVERDVPPSTPVEESEMELEKMVKGFRYEEYSESRFNELKGKQPIVLNFHADWCPKCRALDAKIDEHRDEFPEDVVMFDVDFDTYQGLKAAYGITIQTTLVFFDRTGEQVAKEFNPSVAKLKEIMATL